MWSQNLQQKNNTKKKKIKWEGGQHTSLGSAFDTRTIDTSFQSRVYISYGELPRSILEKYKQNTFKKKKDVEPYNVNLKMLKLLFLPIARKEGN